MARTLIVALAVLLGMAVSVPDRARGDEPPTEPVLRIEADMHSAKLNRIAIDAAGRYLASGSNDKTVRVWDLSSGRLLRILRPPLGAGNEALIYAVAMSPDGATIAAGGWTGYEWDQANSIYFFDRATGHIKQRISGLPAVINHLAWSSDGALLAAGLGLDKGVRVFRTRDGSEVGADTAYGDLTVGVDIHRTGKLVSTSLDGFIRLYRVSDRALTLIKKEKAPGGARPFSVRFSPDGSRIAVGYYIDGARVDVLAGDTLTLLYSADTRDVKYGSLFAVAWSADGSQLYAGGTYAHGPTHVIRVWTQAGRGSFRDLAAAANTIMDLAPLAAGGIAYGAFEPAVGMFDGGGRKIWERRAPLIDHRSNRDGWRISRDGSVVDFVFDPSGQSPARINVAERRVVLAPAAESGLTVPLTSAPGVDVRDWLNGGPAPTLNGRPLTMEQYELARAVAIAPDRQSVILGSDWHVRRFDIQGNEIWRIRVATTAWAVNVSGDGKVVVIAQGDGTIRWHRFVDGAELLAFFPHADRQRWVLWSPSGYYDAAPGGEGLIGWHLNRGKDVAADFYPVSRFRSTFYRPDVVAKALESLDERTALRVANEDAGRRSQAVDIAKTLPPIVQIVAPTDGTAISTPEVRVRFALRTAPDAPIIGMRARVNGQAVNLGDARNVGPTTDAVRELAIPIPPQDSDIMLFAENRHGVSVPAVLHVTWRGGPSAPSAPAADFNVKPKLYVLAVGVSNYQDVSMRLRFPAKDARDFAQAMQRQRGGLYRDVEVKILTDAQATKDEVLDGLDWLRKEVTQKDVGMLFLAGHGVNDPTGIYYYLPSNADTDKLMRTGVPFSDIKNTLSSLAGKALFFVDTCHSGNVMGARRAGPTDITGVVNELASAENGVVVFASSTGRQYSLESAEWNNGAFTKALVEGLLGQAAVGQTGRITHKMLDFYVAERVKTLTKGQQTPVNTSPQGVPDFPIALVK